MTHNLDVASSSITHCKYKHNSPTLVCIELTECKGRQVCAASFVAAVSSQIVFIFLNIYIITVLYSYKYVFEFNVVQKY